MAGRVGGNVSRDTTQRVLVGFWIAVGAAALGAIAWRLPMGVDLGDESYYAVFNLWWSTAQEGPSPSQSLHSTASSLTQPLVWVWWRFQEFDGLVLFLRFVWLSAALTCAVIAGFMVGRLRGVEYALPTSLLVLAFAPFSLIAPSYNTLGVLGLTSGLSLSLIAVSLRRESKPQQALVAGLLSGSALALGSIAYPTLTIASLVFMVCLLHPRVRSNLRPVISGFVLVVAVWSLYVTLILRLPLVDSYRTTAAMKFGDESLMDKLTFWSSQLGQQRTFLLLVCASLALGTWLRARRRVMSQQELLLAVLLLVLLLVFSYSQGPVFFARSHDLVILLAVLGIPVVGFGTSTSLDLPRDVVICIKFTFFVGWLAGLLFAYSADMGLLNLALGLLPSTVVTLLAVVGVDAKSAGVATTLSSHLLLITAVVLLMLSLVTNVYGDDNVLGTNPKVRVSTGPFAGLLTTEQKSRDIARIQEVIQRACDADVSQLMVGSPGLYLLSVREPRALTPWNQSYDVPEFKQELITYYSKDGNRPECVGVIKGSPIAAIERQLAESLPHRTSTVLSGDREFAVYSARPID